MGEGGGHSQNPAAVWGIPLRANSPPMAAPLATNVNVKQEEPDPDTGLCLICTLPIRIPGGEPDALLCSQCGVVYHRVCAPEWTSECTRCRSKVSAWSRLLPPGPGLEILELDGDGQEEQVEEEEEDEAVAKRRKKAAYARAWHAQQPVQRCGVDGCKFRSKQKGHLKTHHARVHGIGDVDAEELRRKQREYNARRPAQRCGVDGCEYQTNRADSLTRHQAHVHGIGDVDAGEQRRKQRERCRKRVRQSGESEDTNEEDEQHEVATVTPRSFRSGARRSLRPAPPVNYAADAGSSSDDSSAK